MHDIDISNDPAFQLAQNALHREHVRATQLAALKSSMPRRKTGEMNALFKFANSTHSMLVFYDKLETPPAECAGQAQVTYDTAIARLAEICKPKAADDG